MILGGERRLQAIGRNGVVVASLDPARVRLRAANFPAEGVRLNLVEPGASFHLDTVAADAADHTGAASELLERVVEDLVRDVRAGARAGPMSSTTLRCAVRCCRRSLVSG